MRILSVNTAHAVPVIINGKRVLTAIGKQPRSGRVEIGAMGLDGDEQADLSVHGGLSKAVYAYPDTHYPFWRTVRAQANAGAWDDTLPWGLLGENLTVEGLSERDLWIGDRLRLPDGAVLSVSEPRLPCFKFNAAMGFAKASKMMAESGYCGTYLAVLHPGSVAAGDDMTLEPGPREVRLIDLFRARMHRKSV